jgi:uridylate kinase
MNHKFGNTIVIALGGSILHPDRIDTDFIKAFKTFALDVVKPVAEGGEGKKLVIVIGGGKLARVFQDAAAAIGGIDNEDKDWLGIHSTRLNGHLLRTVFKDVADPVVIDERGKMTELTHPITIASGWRPGWSTDYIAVQLAVDFGAGEAVIAGKPAYVYDKDPSAYPDAKPLPELSWSEYRKLVPAEWSPGLSAPVDPVAAELGERAGVAAIIINGKDLANFGNLLKGAEFEGSIVK